MKTMYDQIEMEDRFMDYDEIPEDEYDEHYGKCRFSKINLHEDNLSNKIVDADYCIGEDLLELLKNAEDYIREWIAFDKDIVDENEAEVFIAEHLFSGWQDDLKKGKKLS